MPMLLLRVLANILLYSIHVGKCRALGFLHMMQEYLAKQVPHKIGKGSLLQWKQALQLV